MKVVVDSELINVCMHMFQWNFSGLSLGLPIPVIQWQVIELIFYVTVYFKEYQPYVNVERVVDWPPTNPISTIYNYQHFAKILYHTVMNLRKKLNR